MEIDEDDIKIEFEPRRANSVKRRRATIYEEKTLPRSSSMRLKRNEHPYSYSYSVRENVKDIAESPTDAESMPRRINSFKRRMQTPEENKAQEPAVKRTGSIKGYDENRTKIRDPPSENQQPEGVSPPKRSGSLKKRMYRDGRSESVKNLLKTDFKNVLRNWKRKTEIMLRDKLVHLGLAEEKHDEQSEDGKWKNIKNPALRVEIKRYRLGHGFKINIIYKRKLRGHLRKIFSRKH